MFTKTECKIIVVVVPLAILCGVFIGLHTIGYFDPYFEVCMQTALNVDGLGKYQCMEYLRTNPDATGQEMLDYYSNQSQKTLDKILSEPVASLDVDTP